MAERTEVLKLKKPSKDEFFSIDDFNENADIMDNAVKSLSEKMQRKDESAISAKKLSEEVNINGIAFDGSEDVINFGVCSTSAVSATKEVTIPGFKLVTGARIHVLFEIVHSSSSTVKLNINGEGPIETNVSNYFWGAGDVVSFTYNGSKWIMDNSQEATDTVHGVVALSDDFTVSNPHYAPSTLAVKRVKDLINSYGFFERNKVYKVGDRILSPVNGVVLECIEDVPVGYSFNSGYWKMVPDLQRQIDDMHIGKVLWEYENLSTQQTVSMAEKVFSLIITSVLSKYTHLRVYYALDGRAQMYTADLQYHGGIFPYVDIPIAGGYTDYTLETCDQMSKSGITYYIRHFTMSFVSSPNGFAFKATKCFKGTRGVQAVTEAPDHLVPVRICALIK